MACISTSMAGIGSAVIALAIHATWTVTSAADPSMDRFGNWVVGSPSPGMCSMTSIPGKARKSSSKIALSTAAVALWTILSSSAATASGRLLPSSFGM